MQGKKKKKKKKEYQMEYKVIYCIKKFICSYRLIIASNIYPRNAKQQIVWSPLS